MLIFLIFLAVITRIEAMSPPTCCLLCDVIRFSLETIHVQRFSNEGVVIEGVSFSKRALSCQVVNGIRLNGMEP